MLIFHSEPDNGRRATVAGRFNEDNSRLEMSAAVCCANDQYIRKRGNAIASGRLRKNKILETVEVEGRPTHEVFRAAAVELASRVCNDVSQISSL